jgi:D-beta-D-heptose 7-phosphate kinase/D-beta-D-heptose 1-phosphate adenosyltransferase
MRLSVERARAILQAAAGRRVLVVGDLMLDRYIEGSAERLSPEAPVPVVLVRRERAVPGGASNVALNIQALGGHAALAGVVGDDAGGRELLGILATRGVDLAAVHTAPDLPTVVKTRVLADRQQVVRIDREERAFDRISCTEPFFASLREAATRADALILEDYGKGVIQQPVVDEALAVAHARGIPSGYDPKDNHFLRVDGVSLATPNRREALHGAGVADLPPGHSAEAERRFLEDLGRRLQGLWRPETLMLTLGALGIMLFADGNCIHRAGTRAREVFDVSGAGDTVIATAMLALAAGASPVEAAELGNFAAGVVVGKLGTAICSPEELLLAVEAAGSP